MPAIVLGIAAALLSNAAVAAPREPTSPPPNTSRPLTLVERLGLGMPEWQARHEIGFGPFAPPRRIVAVALLPPFHGDDTRANRGIGFEYADDAGRRYVLAQWPAHGGNLASFAPFEHDEPGCSDARTFSRGAKPNGIVWSTPHGLILSLQTDGANDARTLEIEWTKLIRRGACR